MRTSLNKVKLIDGHIFNTATVEDALLFEALLILDPELSGNVLWQKKAHLLVEQYSRKKLKAEIAAVHRQLFNNPAHKAFRERILGIFK